MTSTLTHIRRSPAKAHRRGKRADTSALVARWVSRHMWRGCRWCAVQSGRRSASLAVRSTRRAATPVREWAHDRARFGIRTDVVACSGCGIKLPVNRQHEHACVQQAPAPNVAAFSGQAVRGDEPIRATAVRLDQQEAFATRASWAARPRAADMTRQEFRAYTRQLQEQQRLKRDDLIEAELYRQAGIEAPAIDEDGDTGTGTTAVVVPLTGKETVTMTEPKDWAKNADVFTEPGIANTEELVAFLEGAAAGGNQLHERVGAFAQLMDAAHVDDKVVAALNQATEAAQELTQQLQAAYRQADDVYGDVAMPDFSKAS